MLAKPTSPGNYRGTLTARDLGGQELTVKEWEFQVKNRCSDPLSEVFHEQKCQLCKDGSRAQNYTHCTLTSRSCAGKTILTGLAACELANPPCPNNCTCDLADALAANVEVRCPNITAMPANLPVQTSLLSLVGVTDAVQLIQSRQAVEQLKSHTKRITVLLDASSLPTNPLSMHRPQPTAEEGHVSVVAIRAEVPKDCAAIDAAFTGAYEASLRASTALKDVAGDIASISTVCSSLHPRRACAPCGPIRAGVSDQV